MTDAELVERVHQGDRAAFESLVRRHLGSVYSVALAVLGDPDEAKDAAQDAWVAVAGRIAGLSRPESFRAWLLQIARNRARDRARGRQRRRTVDLERAGSVAAADDPERSAARAELRRRLARALATLPGTQREVLLLFDLEGWRHGEIAEHLGVSDGYVRHLLFHARRAMRAALREGSPGEGDRPGDSDEEVNKWTTTG